MEVLNEFLKTKGIYSLVMIFSFWVCMAWSSAKTT